MTFSPCHDITTEISNFLSTEDGQRATLDLIERGAMPEAFVDLIAKGLDDVNREILRDEVRQLPAAMIPLVLEAFGFACTSGKTFQMVSELPGEPLEYARSKRVRFAVDYEEDGVRLAVSHVPTRHAGWYRPDAVSARRLAPAG
jgi:hypothetical protein